MVRNDDVTTIRSKYLKRHALLQELAMTLEREIADCLSRVPHVDRIYFRAKNVESFVAKAMGNELDGGGQKYQYPLEEIEDQVAGRILVFYRSDIPHVLAALRTRLRPAEHVHHRPAKSNEFDYETTHMVCLITPDLLQAGWREFDELPQTFELQVRTLAQHAWAEPQHAYYKNRLGLSPDSQRKLYWCAASAWGMDAIWEELRIDLDELCGHE